MEQKKGEEIMQPTMATESVRLAYNQATKKFFARIFNCGKTQVKNLNGKDKVWKKIVIL